MTSLAQLTTMQVGGVPAEIISCRSRDELIAATLELWRTGEDWLLLGGGSNLVAADTVDHLHVISVQNRGIEDLGTSESGGRIFRVQAGENWDDFVAYTVSLGLSGIEAMSGIPGSVGAGPVQNIGAYAQELGQVLTRVEFLDFETHEISQLSNQELEFAYRDSAIKRGRLGLITWVEFELANANGLSAPLMSTQIAAELQVPLGTCVPVIDVRNCVLKLRASKGMVLNPADQDSVS
jgi:UDP-N-acetylmuramate dehydrogenase